MKNIEKYYDVIKQKLQTTDVLNLYCAVSKIRTGCDDCPKERSCRKCCLENFEWLNQEFKEHILDDVERKYLSAVINPFRKKVSYIRKRKDLTKGKKYIQIELCDGDTMYFPYLANDAMYKGMKLDRNYTLEELGL